MRATSLLALILAGCQSGPAAPAGGAQPPGPELAIHSELDFSTVPIEGEIGTFVVKIRNASKKYMILRDLVQPGVGSLVSWQVSMPGTLEFNPRTGEFEYERGPSPQPRPAFNVSFLCPGEELTIKPTIRLLQLPRRYLINYFALDEKDVSANVYFETRVERHVRYRRLFGEDLALKLVPDVPSPPRPGERALPAPEVASHRTVVYPHAETILEAPRQQPLELNVQLEPRLFSLEEAAAKAGVTPAEARGQCTFFAKFEAWILRTPKGLMLINKQGAQTLPEISNPDALFFVFDTIGSGSVMFYLRTPMERRLEEMRPGVFRILPAPCRRCGAPVVRSGDRPPVRCASCKAWLLFIPTTCRSCGAKIDVTGERLPIQCDSCKEKIVVGEDAYHYTLHAGLRDIPALLRVLAEDKDHPRIDVSTDGNALRLTIRR